MPPAPLMDLSALDPNKRVATREEIYAQLPQSREFALLDGIIHFDREKNLIAAIKHIRPDDWWAKGHLPDRPLFPGVLMIESAAQLASYGVRMIGREERFLGFAGLDKVKFRGTVEPPCDLILLGHLVEHRSRRFIVAAQGFVNDTMVFEGRVTGMVM